tara:strand:- start:82 stop:558 length:477 start_codon:yes stop_codon:yes gene_type:complete
MSLCIGAQSVLGTLVTIGVGVVTPDEVRTYVGVYATPIESSEVSLEQPSGTFGIEYDTINHIRLFAEHHSSPMSCQDDPGLNMAGVKFFIPLSSDAKLYTGLAVHDESFDSNNELRNPIIISGIEVGTEGVKLYTEYMTDTYNFDGGRVQSGIKFFFR